jgi:hypothetical protein
MAAPKLLSYIKELFKITQFIKIKSYINEREREEYEEGKREIDYFVWSCVVEKFAIYMDFPKRLLVSGAG